MAPKVSGNSCFDQWRRLILQETKGEYYDTKVLKELQQGKANEFFPYYMEPTDKAVPRALFLGDSVSRGTWKELLSDYSNRGVHLVGAPANCGGFGKYMSSRDFDHWLGPCKWDFVQFNVGLHFHPKPDGKPWQDEYKAGIATVIARIRKHSPSAKIVIALTTPSPLDTNQTYPRNDSSCPNFNKFHKTGFVSSMNEVIKRLPSREPKIPGLWGINDRYSLMIPDLVKYQKPCDVHYIQSGYKRLAQQDWETIIAALNLTDNFAGQGKGVA